MSRRTFSTADAPRSPTSSQAVVGGPLVFASGTVGVDPAAGDLAGETIQEQTRQSLRNCEAILAAAGASLADAPGLLESIRMTAYVG